MRTLTGNWRLKRKWFGIFALEVEIEIQTNCAFDLSPDPIITKWGRASKDDIFKLKIPIV